MRTREYTNNYLFSLDWKYGSSTLGKLELELA